MEQVCGRNITFNLSIEITAVLGSIKRLFGTGFFH